MVRLEPAEPAVDAAPAPELPMDQAAVRADVETWEVGAGDSFWSIAEAVMGDSQAGGSVTDDLIGRYWSRLVTANRDRLAAPDHPDLLIPGQLLVLPQPT
jgi:nucleoid-associated protein YgaU